MFTKGKKHETQDLWLNITNAGIIHQKMQKKKKKKIVKLWVNGSGKVYRGQNVLGS